MKILIRSLALGLFAALLLAPGASWASPGEMTLGVSPISLTSHTATVEVTHTGQGSPVQVKMHVNLRPDGTPGGGPGTHNEWFTITTDIPSPTTLTIDLPKAQPGFCWVQVDVRWKGGHRTVRAPLGTCDDGPSPSPTTTMTVPPTAPHPTPDGTPHHHVTPTAQAEQLAKTGSSSTWLYTGLLLLAAGSLLLGLARPVTRRH